jgi:hypothetical protein
MIFFTRSEYHTLLAAALCEIDHCLSSDEKLEFANIIQMLQKALPVDLSSYGHGICFFLSKSPIVPVMPCQCRLHAYSQRTGRRCLFFP